MLCEQREEAGLRRWQGEGMGCRLGGRRACGQSQEPGGFDRHAAGAD